MERKIAAEDFGSQFDLDSFKPFIERCRMGTQRLKEGGEKEGLGQSSTEEGGEKDRARSCLDNSLTSLSNEPDWTKFEGVFARGQ